MAYQNEFSHVDNSELNLDWLLDQYATFNDRIAEIQAHFDEVAEQMRTENLAYKNLMEQAFNSFKREVNSKVASINIAIEQVSNNVAGFVEDHMNEWQLEAMTGENNDIIIGDYDPQEPIADGGQINEIIINNTAFKTSPISNMIAASFHTTLTQLNASTAGQTSITVIKDDVSTGALYDTLDAFLTKAGEDEMNVPYFEKPSFDLENVDYTALNEMYTGEFTPCNLIRIMRWPTNQILISMHWVRKTGVTFTATNGFYNNVTILLPNI